MKGFLGPAAVSEKSQLDEVPFISQFGRYLIRQHIPSLGDYAAAAALLADRKLERDAVILASYTLPVRVAAWWASLCVRQGFGHAPDGMDHVALRETVLWARAPTKEQHGRLTMLVRNSEKKGPPWYCARAAMLAGYQSDDQLKFVGGRPAAAARSLLAAVYLSVRMARKRAVAVSNRQFVAFAQDVVAGRANWSSL